ncbi:MAG: CYTH domain-containing protein [bacterium]
MNEELEIKFKISNGQFESMHSKFDFSEVKKSTDTYYIMPDPNLYLRVRESKGGASFEYHEYVDEYLTKEWESGVTSPEIIKEILDKLHYQIDVVVEKKRQIAGYKNLEIVLDEITGLGQYLELEGKDRAIIDEVAIELGLKKENQIIGAGYPDLLRANKK